MSSNGFSYKVSEEACKGADYTLGYMGIIVIELTYDFHTLISKSCPFTLAD